MKKYNTDREIEVKDFLKPFGYQMIVIRDGMVRSWLNNQRRSFICDIETSTNEEILEGLKNDGKG